MALILTESGDESLRGEIAVTSLQTSYGPEQSVPVCVSQLIRMCLLLCLGKDHPFTYQNACLLLVLE